MATTTARKLEPREMLKLYEDHKHLQPPHQRRWRVMVQPLAPVVSNHTEPPDNIPVTISVVLRDGYDYVEFEIRDAPPEAPAQGFRRALYGAGHFLGYLPPEEMAHAW